MKRGKQSVKKGRGIQVVKKKKRKQKGNRYPIGVIASLAAPVLGAVAKPIKKIFGGRKRPRRKIKRW